MSLSTIHILQLVRSVNWETCLLCCLPIIQELLEISLSEVFNKHNLLSIIFTIELTDITILVT